MKLGTKDIILKRFILALLLVGGLMVFLGRGFSGLDARLFYDSATATKLLDDLSMSQRQLYVWIEILDFLFVILYTGIFRLMWIFSSARNDFKNIFFLIPGLFDCFENAGILFYLICPGDYFYLPALGFLTFLKWTSGFGFLCLVLFKRLRAINK